MPKKKSKSWLFQIPCPYVDGPNFEVAEIQGWRKTHTYDIASSKVRDWNIEEFGSCNHIEKWATQRQYENEYEDITVVTYDIFDQGVCMITWFEKGIISGVAFKINGTWRIVKAEEAIIDVYERKDVGQQVKITKVTFRIVKDWPMAVAQMTVVREC